ncbi:hypothetical protein PANT111_220130 [Pantoea brenneri]|uniref:Uncharacterized protein n=1 Tax=Pantoea brenneri TaxID=472694 RepID=A0AAX3J8T5_9GAMM|nr:hypothetical protein PANT111_220130 [Pantoea brenneri]
MTWWEPAINIRLVLDGEQSAER